MNLLFKKRLGDYFKFFVLFGFSVLIWKIIIDGTFGYYVNPRLLPLVLISSIFLSIIAFIIFIYSNSKSNSNNIINYILFIIPLLMGFIVPAKTISTAEFNNLSINNSYNSSIPKVDESKTLENPDEYIKQVIDSYSYENAKYKEDIKTFDNGVLVFDDKNYVMMLDKFQSRLSEYIGKSVEISGSVYLDETLPKNQFAIVRPMMSCCSADTSLVGMVCNNETEYNLVSDNWVKIEGTIIELDTPEGKFAGVKALKISPIEKPKVEFVYGY